MRRAATSVIAMVALTLLAGCGSGGAAQVEKKPSAPPKKVVFLKEVKQAEISSWDEKGPSDRELVRYPRKWCRELDKGHSLKLLLDPIEGSYPVGMGWGTQINEAAQLVVLATDIYCPEHKERVAQEARDEGYM